MSNKNYKILELVEKDERFYGNMKVAEIGNQYVFKLHKFNEPMTKTVQMNNGRSFEANSILCMHNGKEILLNLTTNMKNSLVRLDLKVSDLFEVNVVENTKSTYSNKAYYLNAFEPGEGDSTDRDNAKAIKTIIDDKGFDFNEIDVGVVKETLGEMDKDDSKPEIVYNELAKLMAN